MAGPTSLKSTPNDKFFEKLFMAILFSSQSFCQKSAERKSPKKYFSYFVLMSNPGFSSNKPTHYLLYRGDFIMEFALGILSPSTTNCGLGLNSNKTEARC